MEKECSISTSDHTWAPAGTPVPHPPLGQSPTAAAAAAADWRLSAQPPGRPAQQPMGKNKRQIQIQIHTVPWSNRSPVRTFMLFEVFQVNHVPRCAEEMNLICLSCGK